MKKLMLATTLGALLVATGVLAQDGRRQDRVAAMDSNSDGVVSYEEFEVRSAAMFDALDSDSNGALSVEEFSEPRGPSRPRPPGNAGDESEDSERATRRAEMQERMLARLTEEFTQTDTDEDGFVSVAEFVDAAFLRLDVDNNGTLSADEMRGPERRARVAGLIGVAVDPDMMRMPCREKSGIIQM